MDGTVNREAAIAKVLAHFSEEQKQSFTELLEVAMGNLTDKQSEARRICRLCNEGVCRKLGCPVEGSIKPL